MGIKIGAQISSGMIFMLGQVFVFGTATFIADWTGHLSLVENFAPGWIIRFGNLEYSADFSGELILQGLVLNQIQEQLGPDFPDSIQEMTEVVECFDPPTTHLIANVEDLTGVLEGATTEAEDMEDESDESRDSHVTLTQVANDLDL